MVSLGCIGPITVPVNHYPIDFINFISFLYDQMGFIILIGNYKKNKMQHHVIVFKGDDHKIAWIISLIESVATDKNDP